MLERLAAFIVGEGNWLPMAMAIALGDAVSVVQGPPRPTRTRAIALNKP